LIALDTNVLLRLILVDDPAQYKRARALLDAHQPIGSARPRLFVPPLVVCEIVWVLEGRYQFPQAEVIRVLKGLLEARDLEIGDRDAFSAVLRRYERGKGDFEDYYIGESAFRAGCESVATFDEDLHKDEGFIPV
jgi:predicted nucleic-acid-binding protein